MIVFPHQNSSTTCNILNQHLEVINTIKAIIIQHFMRVLRACQSTLARHLQDNARISLPKFCPHVFRDYNIKFLLIVFHILVLLSSHTQNQIDFSFAVYNNQVAHIYLSDKIINTI